MIPDLRILASFLFINQWYIRNLYSNYKTIIPS